MKLNGISKIDNSKGDYIVLVDYGQEGISIGGQFDGPEEAIKFSLCNDTGDKAIVKLLNIGELDLSKL